MSKRPNTQFTCQKCSFQVTKWLGKCPECLEWNSFMEEEISNHKFKTESDKFTFGSLNGVRSKRTDQNHPVPLTEVEGDHHLRFPTKIDEFDRVVGGGIVKGSVILIGGEPGIGKSTLLMKVAGSLAYELNNGQPNSQIDENKILYISGEESVGQLANRAKRLEIFQSNFYINHQSNWETIHDYLVKLKPKFFILDSIQTTYSQEIMSAPGTVSQIREITHEIVNYAKANDVSCVIIGHITKEGNIAGPKTLEHMVDVVIYFEGDQFGQYRILRAIKNRFGNVNEVGIFEMKNEGPCGVPNPSQYFLDQSLNNAYGRSLTTIVEGSRNLFVEIQALVVENKYSNGRRTTQGIDQNRINMLIAVIEKYFSIPLGMYDIYVNVAGSIKLSSRESDLSIIASILSSLKLKPIDNSTIFLGEVGLTGEVRAIGQMEIRLKEICQLNYKRVITSERMVKEYSEQFDIEMIGLKDASMLDSLLFPNKEN
jgi:DNA repair protein RadA/Sms